MKKNRVELFRGFTKSAWKSLIVKSIRLGWVEGLIEAEKNLPKADFESVLIAQLFEDTFPAGWKELDDCLEEIKQRDFISLCSRETHHGRGHTEDFCDLEHEACTIGVQQALSIMQNTVRHNCSLQWVPPRIYNCLYTWVTIFPQDTGIKREPFRMDWKGMPNNVLDCHTYEGKCKNQLVTLLSGHYFNHRKIGQEVVKYGWDGYRQKFANDEMLNPILDYSLFDYCN